MFFAPKHLSGTHALVALALLLPVGSARAQDSTTHTCLGGGKALLHLAADSTNHTTPGHYWRNFAAGFATSILAHEAGHVAASLIVGARPHLGLEDDKPTVYSGIDATRQPYKQFVFSSAGLNVQAIMDEVILDIPHDRGSSLERGILAGGIATAYFYATLGRNAPNSDITYMARTSTLTRTQASLIYAGLATIQTLRIARDGHYANFFLRPSSTGAINVGVALLPAER